MTKYKQYNLSCNTQEKLTGLAKIITTLTIATSFNSGCALVMGRIIGGSNAEIVKTERTLCHDSEGHGYYKLKLYWDKNGRDDDGDGKLEIDYTTSETEHY